MFSFLKNTQVRLAKDQTVLVFLVIAYVATGKLGLMVPSAVPLDSPAISLVWPPAGIALGAFVVLGYRIWPVVLAGSVVLYATTVGPLAGVLAMATGNTIEGLLTAYLINRFAGGRNALQSPENTVRFAGLVILSSTTVSATAAATTMAVTHVVSWNEYGAIWRDASLGNMTGCLLVAPLVMLWSSGSTSRWRPRRAIEAGAVLLCVFLVGLTVFCGFPNELKGYPLEFLCMPVLLWTAFRLGRRSTAIAILILAVLAVFGTLNNHGPFMRSDPSMALMMVQVFMSMTGVMTMALAALGSEYAVAEAQLRELVVTDPLTGLPNYRRLVEVLATEIARSNRHDQSFAVVFFDMDGLKRINDELGHLIGSRAVCRLAETLRASCRNTDTAARYGGDEFVVILPDTDEEGARVVIQRVHDRLAEDTDKPELAVSAGVALYPRDGGTPTTLLSAADRALYIVKTGKANERRRGVVAIQDWTGLAGAR
jgi:diguanylate cyclase (GGDEF)-like protein